MIVGTNSNSTIEGKSPKVNSLFMSRIDSSTGLGFPVPKMTWREQNGEYMDCITVFTKGAEKLELYSEQPNIIY
ncbi:MAG: hypothetical protein AAF383_25775 [Cyanobacteria bacterium P01_A01_bin.83]